MWRNGAFGYGTLADGTRTAYATTATTTAARATAKYVPRKYAPAQPTTTSNARRTKLVNKRSHDEWHAHVTTTASSRRRPYASGHATGWPTSRLST